MNNPQYYVFDSNTIFDLHCGELLESVFRLPCKFVITDFLKHELRNPPFDILSDMGLIAETLDPDNVREIISLQDEYPYPSYEDISVLVLAKYRNTVLITGDNDLRHAAISKGVECLGTCWLIDFLANQSIITYGEAVEAYDRIRRNHRNPPFEECSRLLSQWKQRKKLLE